MPIFISVRKVVPLKGIKSALVMLFSTQTINKIPLKASHIILTLPDLGGWGVKTTPSKVSSITFDRDKILKRKAYFK